MKMRAAVIQEQGVTFAVVHVNSSVTNYTSKSIYTRRELQKLFPGLPVILMSLDSNGSPHFYGRKDIVSFLQSIRLDQIPWRSFDLVPVY